MDAVTLALAKKYTDSQRLAYADGFSITWDGNTEGRDAINYQGRDMFFKVSDRVLTAAELESAKFVTVVDMADGVEDNLITEQDGVFDSTALGLPAGLFVGYQHNPDDGQEYGPILISGHAFNTDVVSVPSDGTYFAIHPGMFHLHKLIIETIHPIDPKYLPGVCLPVVEINTVPTEDGAPLTEAESAMMDEVAKSGMPIVVKANNNEGDLVEVTSNVYSFVNLRTENTNMTGYSAYIGNGIIRQLLYLDSMWMFNIIQE